MPEMSNKFTPAHYGDQNPNPKLLKLVRKITDRLLAKMKGITTKDPEYWGFACIFEDELTKRESSLALDLMLAMKVREHYAYSWMKNKLKAIGAEEKEGDDLLQKLSVLGMLEYDYGDKYTKDGPIKGTTYNKEDRFYWIPLFVPGSAEYTNMNKGLMDRHPELAMFFERMTFLPLEDITAMIPEGGCGIGMHVIPVEKAIEMEPQKLDIEQISYWLKRYEGHIGASLCSCRYGRKKLDEGCADNVEDWCIGVGDMADYCRETGRGKDVTYEEAMAILRNAEKNGYVHQITNIDGEGKIFAICNCNLKVCNALRTSQLFNTPNMSRSAYTAKVEKKNCVACGGCVEVCPAGAVKLGQKLCTKEGKEKEYPIHVLPYEYKWGKEQWDENYRDTARINCYDSGTAPCKTACPAHIAVQGYIKKASLGKYDEALALIKKENPFPAICGRVCNKRCEEACTRATIDKAVAIDDIKRFVADLELNENNRYVPEVIIASNRGPWQEKIAIIGGGPAGLSCAYYLAAMGYKPTVFEKNEKLGGMLRYGIPSYKLSKDVIDAEIDVIKKLGVEFKLGVTVGKDVTIKDLRKEGYKAFYLATGCQEGSYPNIENDHANGTTTAVDFLKEYNCGEKKLSGKVIVVGGGNVAVDCARVAKRSGAASVTMISLESKEIMPAAKIEIEEAIEDGVTIINGFGPKTIALDSDKVSKVVFKECTSVFDENHKFAPKYNDANTKEFDANLLIFATGQRVNYFGLLDGEDVKYYHGNYPVCDSVTFQTNVKDIFIGGDLLTGPKFAIDAIAEGKKASESLHRFVQGGHMTIGLDKREYKELDKKDILVENYDNSERQVPLNKTESDLFKENVPALTEEQVKVETNRCLSCGAAFVDYNKCIGCGLCTTRCKFDAIHLLRDHPNASTMVKAEDKFGTIIPYMVKKLIKQKKGAPKGGVNK